MGYGNRSTRTDTLNYSPCPSCETPVYWQDGPYCVRCDEQNPERWCASCERTSKTLGATCLHCEQPLGRLTFGRDRLAAGKQRIGGWTNKAPDPEAVWEIAPGAHYFRGEVDERPLPVVKGFAPGIGFPESGSDPANRAYLASIRKGEGDPGTTWYTCFVCGDQLRGTTQYERRERILAGGDPGTYAYSKTERAHRTCPRTEDEEAALAAHQVVRAIKEVERIAREQEAREKREAARRLNGGEGMAAIAEALASASAA